MIFKLILNGEERYILGLYDIVQQLFGILQDCETAPYTDEEEHLPSKFNIYILHMFKIVLSITTSRC